MVAAPGGDDATVRAGWIIAVAVALMAAAGSLLLPLPDSCDEPGSLVLCATRASAAGLTFRRNSPWPTVEAVAVLLAIAIAGAALTARALRRSRRLRVEGSVRGG